MPLPTQRIVLFIGLKCRHGPNIKISFGYVDFTSIKSCSKAVLILICEDITNHVLECKIIRITNVLYTHVTKIRYIYNIYNYLPLL